MGPSLFLCETTTRQQRVSKYPLVLWGTCPRSQEARRFAGFQFQFQRERERDALPEPRVPRGARSPTGAGNPKRFRTSQRVSRSALSPTHDLRVPSLLQILDLCRLYIAGLGEESAESAHACYGVKGWSKMTSAAVKLSP